jgi:hypothetical protein
MLLKKPAFPGIGKKIPSKNRQFWVGILKNPNQRTASSGYFNTLKEPSRFMEESQGFLSGYLAFSTIVGNRGF